MLCKYKTEALDAQTFLIEETTPMSNALCYLLCGAESALMIDTGLSIGNTKKAADSLTKLPITVVNTHAHLDHMGSNYRFGEIFLHEDDKALFRLHTDPDYVVNELLKTEFSPFMRKLAAPIARRFFAVNTDGSYHHIRGGYVFHLGDRDVEVVHTPGHSAGSICLLDRQARMLFSGDTVCAIGILLNLEGSTPPEVFLSSIERLQALAPAYDKLWPGHHTWPLEQDILTAYRGCAREIIAGTAKIVPGKNRRLAEHGEISIAVF